MAQRKINYGIGFTVDKTGLQQLQSLFQTIAYNAEEPGNKLNQGLQKAGQTATQLDKILEECFNADLGTLNISKFNEKLKSTGLTLQSLKNNLAGAGTNGSIAFNTLGSAILKTNVQLKTSNKLLDEMAVSMANTVKWGITSSIFNTITNSISKAVNYTKQLNRSLNDIRIVTGKSKQDMAEFAVEANNVAKALGSSTLDYTNASLIYAQQGLSNAEVKARAEVTVKTANVTGQAGEEVSEQLTAVWNGYKVTAEEAELYVDKLAAVAASTAADLEELSTGMSKVAAAANSMGVDVDQLNAQLSTIVSVTRQAPESVGTALKTIYARMGDLKMGQTDEDGLSFGDVSGTMAKAGISITDSTGELRDMGEVIEEVAGKWDMWNEATKKAMASSMAGTRQYNNLYALFENWSMYEDALETSQNAMGTLDEQNEIYLESTSAKLQELRATWEDLYASLVKDEELNQLYEMLTNMVQAFDNFIDAFGGGVKSIAAFGAIVSGIFQKQITKAITSARIEQKKYQDNVAIIQQQLKTSQMGVMSANPLDTDTSGEKMKASANTKGYEVQLELAKQILAVKQAINTEDYNSYMQQAAEIGAHTQNAELIRLQLTAQAEKAGYTEKELEQLMNSVSYREQQVSQMEEFSQTIAKSEQENLLYKELISDANTSILNIDKLKIKANEKEKEINKTIFTLNKSIEESNDDQLKQEVQSLKYKGDIKKISQELIKINENIDKRQKNSSDLVKEQSKMFGMLEAKVSEYSDELAASASKASALSTHLKTAKQNLTGFQIIGTITSSLSGMANAWGSISSVMDAILDKETSLGDKVTQILTTGFTGISMMVNTLDQLGASFGKTTGLWETLSSGISLASNTLFSHLSLQDVAIIKSNLESISIEELEDAKKALAIERNKDVNLLTAEEILQAKVSVLNAKGTAITYAQASATEKAVVAQNALNLSMATNPAVIVIAAIAGVIAVVAALAKAEEKAAEAEEKATEKRKENLKTLIEDTKARREAAQTVADERKELVSLAKTYDELYDKYKSGLTLKDDFVSSTTQLVEELGVENGALLLLSGNYELLQEKIHEAYLEQLRLQKLESEEVVATSGVEARKELELFLTEDKGTGEYAKETNSNKLNPILGESEYEDEIIKEKGYQSTTYANNNGYKKDGLRILKTESEISFGDGIGMTSGKAFETKYGEDKAAEALLKIGGFSQGTKKTTVIYQEKYTGAKNSSNHYGDADQDIEREYVKEEITNSAIKLSNKDIKDMTDAELSKIYQGLVKSYEAMNTKDSGYYIKAEDREDNEYYTKTENLINQLKDSMDPLIQASTQIGVADLKIDNDDILTKIANIEGMSYDDFVKSADEIKKQVENMINSESWTGSTDFNEVMSQVFSDVENEFMTSYLAIQEFLNNSDLGEDEKKKLEKYLSKLEGDELEAFIKISPYLDENSTVDYIQQEMAKVKSKLLYDTTNLEMVVSIRQDIVNGDGIDAEKIEKLRTYNNGEYAERLVNIENKSYKEQLEILEQITEEQNKQNAAAIDDADTRRLAKMNEINIAIDKAEEKKENLMKNLQAATTEAAKGNRYFESRISNIKDLLKSTEEEIATLKESLEDAQIDFDIDIDLSVFDIFENKIDSIVSKSELLKNTAEMIGEGWIVAKDDMESFSNMYPQLLENAKVLKDGSVQLDQALVESKLEADRKEIWSDTYKTSEALNNQMEVTKMKIDYLKAENTILEKQLKGEIDKTEAENELATNSTNYKGKLTELATKTGINANELGVESNTNATDQIENNMNELIIQAGVLASAMASAFAGEEFDAKNAVEEYQKQVAEMNKNTTSPLSTEEKNKKLKEAFGWTDTDLLEVYAEYGGERTYDIYEQILANNEEISILENLYGDYKYQDSKLWGEYNNYVKMLEGTGTNRKDTDNRNEELKKFEDEFDRYWQINKKIDETTDALDDLANKQDNLFGEELQNSLAKSNKLLENQIKNYEDLYKAQEQEAKELRNLLVQYGSVFDAEGRLTNYDAVTNAALNKYNAATAAYNAGAIDDAAYEAATMKYDTFVEKLERYNDLFYEEMVETMNTIDEKEREKLENALTGWEAVIEVTLDENQLARDWQDFVHNMNKDFTLAFEDLGAELSNISNKAEFFPSTIYTDINAINTTMKELQNLQSGLGSSMFESESQAKDKLSELIEQFSGDAEEMKGLYEEAWNAYINGIEQAAERFNLITEEFERIDEELEYQGELIKLNYGEEAYDLMDKLYKQQEKNAAAQIQALQIQVNAWKQQYEAAEEGSEEQKKFYDLMNEAQSNLNDKIIEYIELLKDDYANAVSNILKTLEKDITGSSLDDISEQWDRITEKSDKYLDNLQGLYEAESLAMDIQNEIANMDDIKDQQKLQKLLDKEIDTLREKENLTQYDLDAAKARLEIAKAEIDLENAQNSKNSMKLVRGADGNWSYQYVADADNIANKQQELMDKMNEYYELTKKAHQENLDSMIDVEQKLYEQLEDIANNEVWTQEEKLRRMQEAQKWYEEQMSLLAQENALYRDDLMDASAGLADRLYKQDAENFEAMTEDEKKLVLGLKDAQINSFYEVEKAVSENLNNIGDLASKVATDNIGALTSSAQALADAWNKDDGASVKSIVSDTIQSINDKLSEFQTKVDEAATMIGEDFSATGVAGAIGEATSATEELINDIAKLAGEEIGKNLTTFKDKVDIVKDAWTAVKDEIADTIALVEEFTKKQAEENKDNGAGNITEEVKENNTKPSTTPVNTTPTTSTSPVQGSTSSTATPQGDGRANKGDKITLKSGGKVSTNSYKVPNIIPDLKNGKQLYIQQVVDRSRNAPYHIGTSTDFSNVKSHVGWTNLDQIQGYDTGGYTGSWGSNGKMAFLHEKELVLNKDDTQNILSAVNGIRQLSSVESAISQKIASMIMNMVGMGVNTNYNTNEAKSNLTEQVFHVNANFPNANNAEEIRQAILSLPGLASQQVGLNLI